MGAETAPGGGCEQWPVQLEELINQMLNRLKAHPAETVKISELIKLMELHRKLAGKQANTKEFWAFIEDIRSGRITCDDCRDEDEDSDHEEKGGISGEDNAGGVVPGDD